MTLQQAFHLALQHHLAGRLEEAEALYRQILAAQTNHSDAIHMLGVIAHQSGGHDIAAEWIRRAVTLDPNNAAAYSNLGSVYRAMNRFDEAIDCYRRALDLKADYEEAYYNLGLALAAKGQIGEAIAAWRRVIELKPDHYLAQNDLGVALVSLGQIDEAIAAYRHAIEILPDYTEAHNNLGVALATQGRFEEAIAEYRKSLRLQAKRPGVHSNLIFAQHFLPSIDRQAIADEQLRWNRQFADSLKQLFQSHTNDPNSERKLRIGYVSPFFCDQVVGRNLLPLFRHHDPENVEILCYGGVGRPDQMTAEFRKRATKWRDTLTVTDERLSEIIRQDGVDILVDLTQHMAGNRLPVFARKPAPVQVSFAGYPESTGLEAIEYRISDRWLEEERMTNDECGVVETETKEYVFLIDSFWCYDPCGMDVAIDKLPAKGSGAVTFGCLNNFGKVNEAVLRLWARVLGGLKDSHLILLAHPGSHRQRTLEFLEREGVEPKRVEFVEPRPRREYLELYHRLDIVLDTFPYNGHTTSLDALWMGVPVVSLAGQTAVSRAGLSQLSNLGLPELVAHSDDEYIEIATRLAGDLPRLAELRRTLRPRMEGSVLMDAPRFARNIEAAYRAMWRRWCSERTGQ